MKDSLYEKIYKKIAYDIRVGNLKPDTKLMSVRKYSEENAISRNTVLASYNLLLAEGYIYSKEKSGYYVSKLEQGFNQEKKDSFSDICEEATKDEGFLNLSSNLVDSSLFPYSTLRQLYRETLSGSNIMLLEQSGSFMGDLDLRLSIARYVYQHKGIECSASQVVIGNGTASHLQSLPRLFDKQVAFLMDDPGFSTTNEIVKDTGCPVSLISIDDQGSSITEIRKTNEKLKNNVVLLHVSPSHQFPLGRTMTAPRRTSILKWAIESENRYIIEDDYDSDFRYNGHPILPLCSMDTHEKVIYIGTFSRTLTPSLRISYMILPRHLLKNYHEIYSKYPCPVSRIDQKVVSLFMDGNFFERHISRMRRIYKTRRNNLIEILKAECPSIEISGEEAGLHFIAKFPLKEEIVIALAKEHKILLNGTNTGWVIIGYAHLSDLEMQKVRSFAKCIEQKRSIV